MNPPSDQTYLAALGLDPTGGVPAAGRDLADNPFPRVPPLDWQAYASPEWNRGVERTVPSGDVKGRLRASLGEQVVQAASGLDSSLNNTSLMLSFEIGDQYLLFPGDAQWGPWRQSLAERWSADLLRRTTFLKIGHHGSHNATPVDLVEALPRWRVGGRVRRALIRSGRRSPRSSFSTSSSSVRRSECTRRCIRRLRRRSSACSTTDWCSSIAWAETLETPAGRGRGSSRTLAVVPWDVVDIRE